MVPRSERRGRLKMLMSWIDFLVVALAAIIGAGAVFTVIKRIDQSRTPVPTIRQPHDTGPVFLFEANTLIDATPDALAMISPHLDHMSEYDAALHVFGSHFPDLRQSLEEGANGPSRVEDKGTSGLWLDVERQAEKLRIAVKGTQHAKTSSTEIIERDIRLSELTMLRDLTQHTPQLIWQEDLTGKLLWANNAYLSFCDKLRDETNADQTTWPSTPLLPDLHETNIGKAPSLRRVSVTLPDKKAEQWFDVTSVRREDSLLHFANDANAIVRADQERRNFVQTLTKTFAQLSIGLAIFDKRRQLAMFNPALLDMTNLPIQFLSARPTVDAVLDRLRESRMLPEPKDYTSWREQFTALEQAAKDGSYSETWNLPDGQTYRVTGRPHPDGAIAFLFEDISAEVSLTRRFRSDIETGQAVLDTLPEAIAVFSSAGTMVLSNDAYSELWGPVCDKRVQQYEVQTAIQTWQKRCTPTPIWADLRAFIHLIGPRKPWSDHAILEDGRQIKCEANPITGGMTMVKFSFAHRVHPVIHKLTQHDPALRVAKR